jgi:hypothetical protein
MGADLRLSKFRTCKATFHYRCAGFDLAMYAALYNSSSKVFFQEKPVGADRPTSFAGSITPSRWCCLPRVDLFPVIPLHHCGLFSGQEIPVCSHVAWS